MTHSLTHSKKSAGSTSSNSSVGGGSDSALSSANGQVIPPSDAANRNGVNSDFRPNSSAFESVRVIQTLSQQQQQGSSTNTTYVTNMSASRIASSPFTAGGSGSHSPPARCHHRHHPLQQTTLPMFSTETEILAIINENGHNSIMVVGQPKPLPQNTNGGSASSSESQQPNVPRLNPSGFSMNPPILKFHPASKQVYRRKGNHNNVMAPNSAVVASSSQPQPNPSAFSMNPRIPGVDYSSTTRLYRKSTRVYKKKKAPNSAVVSSSIQAEQIPSGCSRNPEVPTCFSVPTNDNNNNGNFKIIRGPESLQTPNEANPEESHFVEIPVAGGTVSTIEMPHPCNDSESVNGAGQMEANGVEQQAIVVPSTVVSIPQFMILADQNHNHYLTSHNILAESIVNAGHVAYILPESCFQGPSSAVPAAYSILPIANVNETFCNLMSINTQSAQLSFSKQNPDEPSDPSQEPQPAQLSLFQQNPDEPSDPSQEPQPAQLSLFQQNPDEPSDPSQEPQPAQLSLFQQNPDEPSDPSQEPQPAQRSLFQQNPDEPSDPSQEPQPAQLSLFQQNPDETSDLFQELQPAQLSLFQQNPDETSDPFQELQPAQLSLFQQNPDETSDLFQELQPAQLSLFQQNPDETSDPFQELQPAQLSLFQQNPDETSDPFQEPHPAQLSLFQQNPDETSDLFQELQPAQLSVSQQNPDETSNPSQEPSSQLDSRVDYENQSLNVPCSQQNSDDTSDPSQEPQPAQLSLSQQAAHAVKQEQSEHSIKFLVSKNLENEGNTSQLSVKSEAEEFVEVALSNSKLQTNSSVNLLQESDHQGNTISDPALLDQNLDDRDDGSNNNSGSALSFSNNEQTAQIENNHNEDEIDKNVLKAKSKAVKAGKEQCAQKKNSGSGISLAESNHESLNLESIATGARNCAHVPKSSDQVRVHCPYDEHLNTIEPPREPTECEQLLDDDPSHGLPTANAMASSSTTSEKRSSGTIDSPQDSNVVQPPSGISELSQLTGQSNALPSAISDDYESNWQPSASGFVPRRPRETFGNDSHFDADTATTAQTDAQESQQQADNSAFSLLAEIFGLEKDEVKSHIQEYGAPSPQSTATLVQADQPELNADQHQPELNADQHQPGLNADQHQPELYVDQNVFRSPENLHGDLMEPIPKRQKLDYQADHTASDLHVSTLAASGPGGSENQENDYDHDGDCIEDDFRGVILLDGDRVVTGHEAVILYRSLSSKSQQQTRSHDSRDSSIEKVKDLNRSATRTLLQPSVTSIDRHHNNKSNNGQKRCSSGNECSVERVNNRDTSRPSSRHKPSHHESGENSRTSSRSSSTCRSSSQRRFDQRTSRSRAIDHSREHSRGRRDTQRESHRPRNRRSRSSSTCRFSSQRRFDQRTSRSRAIDHSREHSGGRRDTQRESHRPRNRRSRSSSTCRFSSQRRFDQRTSRSRAIDHSCEHFGGRRDTQRGSHRPRNRRSRSSSTCRFSSQRRSDQSISRSRAIDHFREHSGGRQNTQNQSHDLRNRRSRSPSNTHTRISSDSLEGKSRIHSSTGNKEARQSKSNTCNTTSHSSKVSNTSNPTVPNQTPREEVRESSLIDRGTQNLSNQPDRQPIHHPLVTNNGAEYSMGQNRMPDVAEPQVAPDVAKGIHELNLLWKETLKEQIQDESEDYHHFPL